MPRTVTRSPDAVAHGDHVCARFGSAALQQQAVTAFVGNGLAARDRIWYLTDGSSPQQVLDFLRADGLAVDEAVASGQLAVRSAQESYLADGPFDAEAMVSALHAAVDEALADGYAGFRVTGEMSWATRDPAGIEGLLDYERRVGEVFSTRPAAVCQYDTRLFDATVLDRAARLHPHALADRAEDAEQLSIGPLSDRVGLRLTGEVHLGTRNQLRHALDALPAQTGELHLELAGLRFIDCRGVADLVACTQTHPQRRLVLHDPPRIFCRVVDMLWPDVELEVRCS